MCLSAPKAPKAPPPPPAPPEKIFSKTALRVGNKAKAGVKTVGPQGARETPRGGGVSALKLRSYGGMNTGY